MAVETDLARSYAACRRLHARHGRTYYLATLLLPPHKRPDVHALYGFARYADEIVDDLDSGLPPARRAAALDDWGTRFLTDVRSGRSTDPVGRAVVHTARRWKLPVSLFEDFLAAMRMDLTVDGYRTYPDLERYMWGSAAVIGLQMLPILEPVAPLEEAAPYAIALGHAFQLTNFLRDVGEDLRRGRLYLPEEELDGYGVDRAKLTAGTVHPAFGRLMAFQVDRARALYRRAEPGIALLHPTSRDCVRTAFVLYGAILDEIESADYDVLTRRVRVGRRRRASVAVPALARAVWTRRAGRWVSSSADRATPTSTA